MLVRTDWWTWLCVVADLYLAAPMLRFWWRKMEELQCCLTVVVEDLQQYLILIIDEDAERIASIIISWSHFSFLLRRVVVPRAIKDEGKEKSLLRRRSLNKYIVKG